MSVKNELHQNLGVYLKQKRQETRITQKEVAKKLGYTSPQFVSNFERGLCAPPLKNLKSLVKLYRIQPEEIIDLIVKEQEDILRKALSTPLNKTII